MSAARPVLLLAASALAAATFMSDAALAQRGGGGGGRMGDTFIDDAQKNPRFIEPGAQNDPARYRIGAPYEGYVDRQMAARGYYHPGSGYAPVPPEYRRGRVYVNPYRGGY
jgi:hypothetical protein